MRVFHPLLLCALVLLTACSSTKEPEYTSEADLYHAAESQLNRSQWETAIRNLQSLEENFPFGTYAEQAQLELIYAYFMSGQSDAAIASAGRFIRLHPQHRNVDYAYYMMGLSAYDKDKGMFERILPTDLTMRDPGPAREGLPVPALAEPAPRIGKALWLEFDRTSDRCHAEIHPCHPPPY